VNDFGKTARGDPFIVMELLDGEDLAGALAKRGRLSAIKAVRTLLPIAHALTVAHNKGIVHRDLKPENIFLAKNDEGQIHPKLVDFGVAKLEKEVSQRLTGTGALVGSPLYMSPEQARGDEVDHRADIWALAVVLYEAITGHAPFEGKNYNAVIYSIIANPPAPSPEFGVGDPDLWTLLERGFRKEAEERWFSMQDFGEALAHWLEDRGVHEDITGASLTSTWLEWKKDDGLERSPSSDEVIRGSQLPPLPVPPEETRARVITIRKPRPATNRWLVTGAALLVAVVLLVVLWRTRSPGPHVEPMPVAGAPRALRPEPAPAPTERAGAAEHERAVEEALAAAAPSATPEAPLGATVAHPAHPHPHASSLSHGIHTDNPYAAAPPATPQR
jgi:serine/threonine protein kinase